MKLSLDQTASQQPAHEMEMRPSPGLITFARLLTLPAWELEQTIRDEIQGNPALELSEPELCAVCGAPLVDGVCYECLRRDSEVLDREERSHQQEIDEEFDPLTLIAGQVNLGEQLLHEVGAQVHEEDIPIARYLVGYLDDRGFLDCDPELVAFTLNVSTEQVERVVRALQQAGPVGAAARNVKECLLLQLERLADAGFEHPLAEAIIRDHFERLGQGQYHEIARALGVSSKEVLDARDFIRQHLRPFPVPDLVSPESWTSTSDVPYTAPDVIIHERLEEGDFAVEVVQSRRSFLHVNPVYQRVAREIRKGNLATSEHEREHVMEHLSRAQSFLSHLRERRETLQAVAEAVVARQIPFLRSGVRHLRPLTRAEIAEATGLHQSTVSRAVADKYVLLPNRKVIPFSAFFEPSRSVKDVLQEIVEREDAPLADAELAEELSKRGYNVARRTVAKYRKRMGILPSTMR
ncbi:MAG TPA: RNA polymerase factor sigma-54 [Anaerolineae bacterium]|nr:RNA polymerase factor sigma-54 [Anaerolineae bacterium]HPL28032.1 RNA polymerase factor sigma-54 [Anaerolineae bacterium]